MNCHKGHGAMTGQRRYKDSKGADQVSRYCMQCVALARAKVRLELLRPSNPHSHVRRRKTA